MKNISAELEKRLGTNVTLRTNDRTLTGLLRTVNNITVVLHTKRENRETVYLLPIQTIREVHAAR